MFTKLIIGGIGTRRLKVEFVCPSWPSFPRLPPLRLNGPGRISLRIPRQNWTELRWERTMISGKYHVPFSLLAERYFGAGEVAKVV